MKVSEFRLEDIQISEWDVAGQITIQAEDDRGRRIALELDTLMMADLLASAAEHLEVDGADVMGIKWSPHTHRIGLHTRPPEEMTDEPGKTA